MSDYVTGQRAYRRTLAAEHLKAVAALEVARKDYREAKAERIAAVNGELDACPGICWTNEERAEARVEEAEEHEKQIHDQLWSLDADIWDAVACQRAEQESYGDWPRAMDGHGNYAD
ncbi:hypothetical protein MKL09_29215 [Methylobacterium sp. J-048]|uniref:hypothetical protein n=1 Tax=Methylobacterium sp. J-048 TaxID=2836635 RepID=UPI001FB88991|nr:hypothetical protein [Methylobacterium sp. J-048]MCJ2060592.1 hypothetical protein [Methylobacterium sp. J-048]